MHFRTILLLMLYSEIAVNNSHSALVGPPNFIYHNLVDCGDKHSRINLTAIPRWYNKTYQLLSGHLDTPLPIGDNLLTTISVFSLVHDNKWIPVTNVSIKFCQMLKNYMGPSRGSLLSAIGLPPNTCPIPKGVYHSADANFDMRNSRVPVFPYGTFKLFLNLNDAITNVLEMCMEIFFENKSY